MAAHDDVAVLINRAGQDGDDVGEFGVLRNALTLLQGEGVEADLQARLIQVHQSDPEAKVFVRGDRDAVHGNIVHLLDMLRSAGFYKISFEIKSEALKGVPGAGT